MKTPKEKAKDLIEKFGKELSLKCCDEIIDTLDEINELKHETNQHHWQQVKEEINKL